MAGPDPLQDWFQEFRQVTGNTSMRRDSNAAGRGGKQGSQRGAARKVGSDMRLSGMPRARLTVGYDTLTPRTVALNFRPGGVWGIAEAGRGYVFGPIYPKPGRGRKGGRPIPGRAVLTPEGPRARSNYGASPGSKALTEAKKLGAQGARVEARRQFMKEARKALGGPKTYRYRVA